MEPITLTATAIVTWLVNAAKFIKDTGANGTVKEGAKSVFSWLKEKFTRKSEQDKISTVENTPDDASASVKALEQMISDTQKDDAALFASLQEQINQFSKTVSEKMPDHADAINKIINSKNVVIDSFKDLSGHGNISINVGDNNAK